MKKMEEVGYRLHPKNGIFKEGGRVCRTPNRQRRSQTITRQIGTNDKNNQSKE